MKFEDLISVIDSDIRVDVYSVKGEQIYSGILGEMVYMPERVLNIIPQSTNRECYLEIIVY